MQFPLISNISAGTVVSSPTRAVVVRDYLSDSYEGQLMSLTNRNDITGQQLVRLCFDPLGITVTLYGIRDNGHSSELCQSSNTLCKFKPWLLRDSK